MSGSGSYVIPPTGNDWYLNQTSYFQGISQGSASYLSLQETVNLAGAQASLAANSASAANQAATNANLATAQAIAAAQNTITTVNSLNANASAFANVALSASANAVSNAIIASAAATSASASAANAAASAVIASTFTSNATGALFKTGGVMTGLLELGGSGLYTLGSSVFSPGYTNSQGAFHTYHTDPKNNFCPISIEYYPNGDRRNTNQYAALSALTVHTIFQDNTAVSPPGLGYQSQVNAFVMITNTSAQIASNPSAGFGVNGTGFTNLTANYTSARPSQFNNANSIAADQAATAYWSTQSNNVFGVKAPICPPTLENMYSTTDQADFCFLPSTIMGTLVVAENDMQVNGLDDGGSRGGISIIVDQKQRTGANNGNGPNNPLAYYGGPPASVSQGFYVNGIAGAFVQTAYRTGDNVLRSLDTRSAVDQFTAVITAPYTTASPLAMVGTPAPAAAPSPGSSYTVIHVDSISPITAISSYPFYQGGSQGSGIGGFALSDTGTQAVSVQYPATFYVNGNAYQCVAYQLDGPGYESGYLTVLGSMATGDKAVGQQLIRYGVGLWLGDQQRICLEHTGTNYIAYNPAINNGYGGINLRGSVRITSGILEVVNTGNTAGLTIDQYGDLTTSGSVTLTGTGLTLGTSSDLGIRPLLLSPRDGGHGFQWQPYAGQLQVLYAGNSISYWDTAGDFYTNGLINTNNALTVSGTQVVGTRKTGWATPGGTFLRSSLNAGTANTTVIAETLNALITDLIAHGLLGN